MYNFVHLETDRIIQLLRGLKGRDILSWTNQDARESVLFNAWGILYRFQVHPLLAWLRLPQMILPRISDGRQPQQQPERHDALAHYPP